MTPRRCLSLGVFGCPIMLAVVACSSTESARRESGAGSVEITASAEALGYVGYDFPPQGADAVALVDGWAIEFSRVLVSVDHVTLSEIPDTSPGDQSQTGPDVARLDGPWVVDLRRVGQDVAGTRPGKGGGEDRAILLGTLPNQNLKGGKPFDTAQRYAFGFETVAATAAATKVNLDMAGEADLTEMVSRGYSHLLVGSARFKGTSCTPTGDSVLDALPKQVNFRFGFAVPVQYRNCQNPDNGAAPPFPNEEYQRGVSLRQNQSTSTLR